MRSQKVLLANQDYTELDNYLVERKVRKIFLVCIKSISRLKINTYFEGLEERMGIKVISFDEFEPNPTYESVVKGVEFFRQERCDMIIAAGGGSAMDVAKCIKLYADMDPEQSYLEQEIIPNEIKLLAVPTTAGTGSEATRYAVIYYKGEKQSISDWSCIPEAILIDVSVLKTLPMYQKKSAMLDALCHAIESFWSVKATPESRALSGEALEMILSNMECYLAGDETCNASMMKAANIAGKAINITQTTAGHAMCYKLTSLYGISHGHAAALCVSRLWSFMLHNMRQCVEPRGEDYLNEIFRELAQSMGYADPEMAAEYFRQLVDGMELGMPKVKEEEYKILVASVNPVRLGNNPVALAERDMEELYRQILGQAGG